MTTDTMTSSAVATAAPKRTRVALFNSGDPRGLKVGGIETYIRDYIQFHPDDIDLLFVGPDELGDLKLDEINTVTFRGRSFKFLPISRMSEDAIKYPDSIMGSDTFRFLKLMWSKRALLGKVLKGGGYSAEIRRVEYAPFFTWLRVPFVQMVHVWGDKSKPMSSILGKHHYIRTGTEYLAAALCYKFYTVNPDLTAMFKRQYKPFGKKFDTLTTWANTELYKPSPFNADGTLRLLFAGRTDDFKRLDIMMEAVAAARNLVTDPIEFHYVGDGDLTKYPQFEAIKDITVSHGRKPAAEVAKVISHIDIGLLTSEFEGMPRFVIECMASGRPVVALHLPQLERITRDGISGYLVPRSDDQVQVIAQRIADTWQGLKAGQYQPETIADCVEAHRPTTLLKKIWNDHRRLAGAPEAK
jgi:glycosyltransferase involved in cell wall biosynthesis